MTSGFERFYPLGPQPLPRHLPNSTPNSRDSPQQCSCGLAPTETPRLPNSLVYHPTLCHTPTHPSSLLDLVPGARRREGPSEGQAAEPPFQIHLQGLTCQRGPAAEGAGVCVASSQPLSCAGKGRQPVWSQGEGLGCVWWGDAPLLPQMNSSLLPSSAGDDETIRESLISQREAGRGQG